MSEVLIIRPRTNVSAQDLAIWLEVNFQQVPEIDEGPRSNRARVITGGNPLVNAAIKVVDLP